MINKHYIIDSGVILIDIFSDTRTFQCHGSRETIPLEALCNGTAECIDGVDEINPLCASKLQRSDY